MKKILLLPIAVLLFSCGGDVQEQEAIDMDDLFGQTGEIEADSSVTEIDSANVIDSYLGKFIFSQKSINRLKKTLKSNWF